MRVVVDGLTILCMKKAHPRQDSVSGRDRDLVHMDTSNFVFQINQNLFF
jgi:hypothetical protein